MSCVDINVRAEYPSVVLQNVTVGGNWVKTAWIPSASRESTTILIKTSIKEKSCGRESVRAERLASTGTHTHGRCTHRSLLPVGTAGGCAKRDQAAARAR